MKLRIIFLITLLPGLSACAAFERRLQNENHHNSAYDYRPSHSRHEAEAREELGLPPQGYLSSFDRERLQQRVYLKDLEDRLTNRSDKAQYYQIKSGLRNDSERIQFLLLGSRDAKARWITAHGFNRQDTHSEEIAEIIEEKDIALGMSESAVRESWGDPDVIEIAGQPIYGFKRWRYSRIISGNAGYQRELRTVYFEGGRVVGWESKDL